MSGLKFRTIHQVKGYECDLQGEMALPALINALVHVSGMQSDSLGNTEESMSELGLSWIIVQYNITVDRMPKKGEPITLETEAVSYNRFFTYRVFRAFDEKDGLLVEIFTTFSIMNLETRKLVRVEKSLVEPYQADETRSLVRQPKPLPVDNEKKAEQLFRVRYLDIDGNKHVNNSKYFDWIINTVDLDFLLNHQIKTINIKYEKEVEYGNMVTSEWSVNDQEDGTVLTAHQIINGDTIACSANIIWEKRLT